MSVVFATTALLVMTIRVAAATPIPSIMSCQDQICSLSGESFYCPDRQLICCMGPVDNSYQILTMRDGFQCCEGSGKTYHYQNEICVNGKIRPRRQNEDNCGNGDTYNKSQQVCCDDHVYDKLPGAECCLGEYLTDPNESCCHGIKYQISQKVCCPQTHNDSRRPRFELSDIPYGKCCLDVAFDPRNQSCEFRKDDYHLIDEASRTLRRCGTNRPDLYDPVTHGCCFKARPEVYELRTHVCARGMTFKKTDPNQNDICFYRDSKEETAIPYTRGEKTVCVNGKVVNLGPMEEMCGSDIYNTSTDLCCGSVVYEKLKLSGNMCCNMGSGTNFYNPETQICCLNEVSEVMAYNGGGRCCLKTPYDPKIHTCQGGVVKKVECPVDESKCTVSLEKIARIRKKAFVYIGTVSKAHTSSTRNKFRQWSITDVKMFKSKRGKLSPVSIRAKGLVNLKAKKCDCTEDILVDSRYIFVTRTSIRRRKPSINFVGSTLVGDLVIPLDDVEKIGILFKGLSENRS